MLMVVGQVSALLLAVLLGTQAAGWGGRLSRPSSPRGSGSPGPPRPGAGPGGWLGQGAKATLDSSHWEVGRGHPGDRGSA